MKKIFSYRSILLTVMVFALFANIAFKNGDPLPIGSTMPKATLKMQNTNGSSSSMKDELKTNGVLVMFSCNTCPYVIKNQERTLAISEYAAKQKVGVIILNSNEAYRNGEDSYTAMKAYAKEQGYKWNYVVDKDNVVADAFGATRTPECYLFDKNLVLQYHGAIDDSPSDVTAIKRLHLQQAIDEMVANKAVTVKESRSVGCSIKRKG